VQQMVTEIRPGVGAVVWDEEGRILLQERRIGGGWAPPSGGVEPGEEVLAALRRELREETTLEIAAPRLVGVYSDPVYQAVRYLDGRMVQFVTCVFACRRAGGELHGSAEEGRAWRWFAPDALPEALTPYARVWLADALADGPAVVVR